MESIWFYVVNGNERRGPVSEGELKQLLRDGQLAANTLVWKEGMAEWAPASAVADLQGGPSVPPLPGATQPPQPNRPPPSGPCFSRTHNRDLMAAARATLNGRWTDAVVAALICMGIEMGIQTFVQIPLLGLLFAVGYLIIAGPLELGITAYFLEFSRGRKRDFEFLFSGFKNFGTALAAFLLMTLFIFLWMLLLIIPGIIAALGYAMTFYILADNPNLDAMDALRRSKDMMRGNKWKLFCLGWRFFGWALLCLLTCGIGFLWLGPYMNVTFSKFYDDLKANA